MGFFCCERMQFYYTNSYPFLLAVKELLPESRKDGQCTIPVAGSGLQFAGHKYTDTKLGGASFGYKFITSYLFSGVLSQEIWVGGHKFCLWTKYPCVVYHHTDSEEEKVVVYITLRLS